MVYKQQIRIITAMRIMELLRLIIYGWWRSY
jgi:hypothetical protein